MSYHLHQRTTTTE